MFHRYDGIRFRVIGRYTSERNVERHDPEILHRAGFTFMMTGDVYIPALAGVLKVQDPGPAGWTVVLVASLIPLVAGQVYKAIALSVEGGASSQPLRH